MDAPINQAIKSKIFIGCLVTSELKMYLRESLAWKQANIGKRELIEVHCQGKDFIGHFIEKKMLTLSELKPLEQQIREALQLYCPEINGEMLMINLFAQVFIL